MNINPFETVKNYSDMLNKIAVFNFFSGLLFLFIMGKFEPRIQDFLSSYEWDIELLGNNFSIINIVIPFIITVFSRIIKLHDKISDIFNIRILYDINLILIPMASLIKYNPINLKQILWNNRIKLMRKCFYKYASTQENKCEIEYHNVIMAIDQLSWYWIVIEIMFLAFVALIISLFLKSILLIIIFTCIFTGLLLLSFFILNFCKKYTRIEVEQILEDPKRVDEIKNQFNAL